MHEMDPLKNAGSLAEPAHQLKIHFQPHKIKGYFNFIKQLKVYHVEAFLKQLTKFKYQ